MKPIRYLITACSLALALLASAVSAATISFTSTLSARDNPDPDIEWETTLDYLHFRVTQPTTITATVCDLGPNRLALFVSIRLRDSDGQFFGGGGPVSFFIETPLSCVAGDYSYSPGHFVLVPQPEHTVWFLNAGEVPFHYGSSDVTQPASYSITLSGEGIEPLYVNHGKFDGTFERLSWVPEPTAGLLALVGLMCAVRRRKRLVGVLLPLVVAFLAVSSAMAQLIVTPTLSTTSGTLSWNSLNGMGYRMWKADNLWNWNYTTLMGTGGPMEVKLFDPVVDPPVVTGVLPARPSIKSYRVMAFSDGSADIYWSNRFGSFAKRESAWDLRKTPGVAASGLLGGVAMIGSDVDGTPGTEQWLYIWVFPGSGTRPTAFPALPLLPASLDEPLLVLNTSVRDAVRTQLSPAGGTLPVGINGPPNTVGNRAQFALTPYLIDSDRDGYSDYTEILGGSDAYSFASRPADSDGDGFSDAEEAALLAGSQSNQAQSPSPGFFRPYWQSSGSPLVITEFLPEPSGSTAMIDGNGIKNAWVEVFNWSNLTVNVADYGLTKEIDSLSVSSPSLWWAFPSGSGSIAPRSFALIWLSGLTGSPSARPDELHGSFFLTPSTGGKLALFKKTTTTTGTGTTNTYTLYPVAGNMGEAVTPSSTTTGTAPNQVTTTVTGRYTAYPKTKKNQSYGSFIKEDGTLGYGYLMTPTPGQYLATDRTIAGTTPPEPAHPDYGRQNSGGIDMTEEVLSVDLADDPNDVPDRTSRVFKGERLRVRLSHPSPGGQRFVE
jgi:hypothetical protein